VAVVLFWMDSGQAWPWRSCTPADWTNEPAEPDGPLGPSVVVDPTAFAWTDKGWRGITARGQVYYELHVGTFTHEGTFAAAIPKLERLKELGITTIELLPLNEWLGNFGWGYDGVLLYAPTHLYGEPDDVRRFVDAAHALGLGVILDVVYNHFGRGDRFRDFSTHYFAEGASNEWGASVSFDAKHALGAREYIVGNARYWIDEFHFDGLRLDATQAIADDSPEHVVAEIVRVCRKAAGKRNVVVIGENEPQDARMALPVEQGGFGLDAIWNEDFHHAATAAVTLSSEGYLHDHDGTPQELISMAKYGYLFQGQRHDWQADFRGQPIARRVRPEVVVNYLQNHDQVANSAVGRRLSDRIGPSRLRVITAYQLLIPQTPILFQGQEFAASSPFFYFLDSPAHERKQVVQGRFDFLSQFPGMRDPALLALLPDPADPIAFIRSKLDWSEWESHADVVALHRDLLRMRQTDPAFARQPQGSAGEIDGAVIGKEAFLLRYFADSAEDERLVLFNLGRDMHIRSIPDPLMAPPADDLEWTLTWSSSDARYGGEGIWPADLAERWVFRAETALIFSPMPRRPRPKMKKSDLDRYQRELF
jgi:maltooligosyltrehalose trehalohydrolase